MVLRQSRNGINFKKSEFSFNSQAKEKGCCAVAQSESVFMTGFRYGFLRLAYNFFVDFGYVETNICVCCEWNLNAISFEPLQYANERNVNNSRKESC